MEINKQELALWWIRNIVKFFILGLAFFVAGLSIRNTGILDTTDKYNLNPRPVCAPASLSGKTVINCIEK